MTILNYLTVSDDPYYYAALVVDFVLLFALLVVVRQLFGRVIGGGNSTAELAEKDNHAFGISLGGATAALAVVFAGVASGDIATSLLYEGGFVLGYGILGIIMMLCTRWIFDRITFPSIDLKALINGGHIAAGILDAGNMVATSVVIFGVFSWVSGDWLTSLGVVIAMYAVTQAILVFASRYRVGLFRRRNDNKAFGDAIAEGNAALAVRFAGFQIGVALSLSMAGNLVVFDEGGGLLMSILVWAAVAFVLLLVIILLTTLLEKVVLYGIPVSQEVDQENNMGVATVEAGAYIGLGLLLVSLLS